MKVRTKADVWRCVIETVEELMADLDQEPGELTPDVTLMGDLGIKSMDVIHLVLLLKDRIGRSLTYKDVFGEDQQPPSDLSLAQLSDLVCRGLRITA
ncbi:MULTISPECIES: acyl carrier protein [Sorangium]|jgi:acyl carrier protein|uniref:Carrier domain-containing protein n=1 Tax=Sorangium atrum TaxID=2995308 RepID=A0ABT5CGW8_9BACT|nr:phosphopantetheine-binding protein [Sorangium aterium]MDC0685676.1 hypothetical protein [Sorangium aterium]